MIKAGVASNVAKWEELRARAASIRRVLRKKVASLFSFVGGALTSAVRDGDWVLLDEVNLAGSEALLALLDLFNGTGRLRLNDGVGSGVRRHPEFRLFCCMNPSTDVGKRDLPRALASRLAAYYMDEPTAEADLREVVARYFEVLRPGNNVDVDGADSSMSERRCRDVVRFYKAAKLAAKNQLCDGTGRKPCYSLRTLCRAMRIAVSTYCSTAF